MSLDDITAAIETQRKVSCPSGWEFDLWCMAQNLRGMGLNDVIELANTIEREYQGHLEAGDPLLTTVVEVIDGHLALRVINP